MEGTINSELSLERKIEEYIKILALRCMGLEYASNYRKKMALEARKKLKREEEEFENSKLAL